MTSESALESRLLIALSPEVKARSPSRMRDALLVGVTG